MAAGEKQEASDRPGHGAQQLFQVSRDIGFHDGSTDTDSNTQHPVPAKINGEDMKAFVDQRR